MSQEIFDNIFNSWKTCKNNQIIIENISNSKYLFDRNEESIKKTLIIDKCSYLNIDIVDKFNHILILNSNNIFINIKNSLVSGLTLINTKNNTIKIDNNYVNYYEISNTEDCIFIYDKISSNNSYINTIFSYNLNFIISDKYFFKKFITNQSLFSINERYYIHNLELNKLN
jgi:hypothetical protein